MAGVIEALVGSKPAAGQRSGARLIAADLLYKAIFRLPLAAGMVVVAKRFGFNRWVISGAVVGAFVSPSYSSSTTKLFREHEGRKLLGRGVEFSTILFAETYVFFHYVNPKVLNTRAANVAFGAVAGWEVWSVVDDLGDGLWQHLKPKQI